MPVVATAVGAWRAAWQLGCRVAVALLAWSVLGCSHLGRLGVGPVAAWPDDGKTSYGDELRVREEAGTSDGSTLSGVEVEGRLLLSERSQALSLGVGPAYLRWLGPSALLVSVTPALGAEYFDKTVLASAGLHGGLGFGVVLGEREERRGSMGVGWPEMEMAAPVLHVNVDRRRTLLTLELTGATDARSRGVSFAAGLLIGLAWCDEHYAVPAPPLVPGWRL